MESMDASEPESCLSFLPFFDLFFFFPLVAGRSEVCGDLLRGSAAEPEGEGAGMASEIGRCPGLWALSP
eukprot:13254848-Alexandrium_andersonii.AAC.1